MGIGFGLVGTLASGLGQTVEDVCDGMGLPEPVGDLFGGAVNMATGHYGAALEDGIDLLSGDGEGWGCAGREPAAPRPRAAGGGATVPGGPGSPGFDPDATLQQMKAGIKPDWMDAKEWDMFRLQESQQAYSRMVNLLTQLMTMQHETMMAIIRNVKA